MTLCVPHVLCTILSFFEGAQTRRMHDVSDVAHTCVFGTYRIDIDCTVGTFFCLFCVCFAGACFHVVMQGMLFQHIS